MVFLLNVPPGYYPKHLVGDISDAALSPNDPNFTGLTFNVIKWRMEIDVRVK